MHPPGNTSYERGGASSGGSLNGPLAMAIKLHARMKRVYANTPRRGVFSTQEISDKDASEADTSSELSVGHPPLATALPWAAFGTADAADPPTEFPVRTDQHLWSSNLTARLDDLVAVPVERTGQIPRNIANHW